MRLNIKLLRSSRIFPCNPTRLSSLLGTPDRSFMKPGGPVRTMEWTPMRTYNVDLLLGWCWAWCLPWRWAGGLRSCCNHDNTTHDSRRFNEDEPRPKSGGPRVDYRNGKALKVCYVSRRERRMTSQDNTGNHCISQLTRGPLSYAATPSDHRLAALRPHQKEQPVSRFCREGPFRKLESPQNVASQRAESAIRSESRGS
jgi:hypothetical protein